MDKELESQVRIVIQEELDIQEEEIFEEIFRKINYGR